MAHYVGLDSKFPWNIVLSCNDRLMSRRKNEDLNVNSNGHITTVDGVPVRKLFVGNLRNYTVEGELKKVFRSYGNVIEASVVTPKNKPHFAFVMFETPAEATRVLYNRHRIFLANRKLFISPADSWHQPIELPNGKMIWDRRAYEEEQKRAEVENQNEDDSFEYEEEEAEMSPWDPLGSEPVLEDGSCPISKLNDDCLMLIFDLIPMHERFPLHKVCQRWKAVSDSMWRGLRKLDFTTEPLVNDTLTDQHLREYLVLCPNLTSLNIGAEEHKLSPSVVVMIAKLCRNLEELCLREVRLKRRSLAFLAKNCPNLKRFSMDSCEIRHDNEMISLVKTCKHLEHIVMRFSESHSGIWLKYLNCPLKSLSLEMYEFHPEFLMEGIRHVKSTLKELIFVSCDSIRGLDVELIVKVVPELESIAFSGSFPDFKYHSLTPITRLSKLLNLNLDSNAYVSDDFLNALAENCPSLQKLKLSGIDDRNITNTGLNAIPRLKELKYLTVGCMKKMNDNLLKTIANKLKNLEHLDVMGCTNITDTGCISIVNNCKELKTLDVSGCTAVTDLTLIAAVESMKDSTRKLKIIAGDSGIDLDVCWPECIIIDSTSSVLSHYPGAMFILHPDFEIDNDVFLNNLLDPSYEYDLSDLDDEDESICSDDLYANYHFDYNSDDNSDYEDYSVYFH